MPHTTRRRRPQHSKRIQLEDSEGWTHVAKTGRGSQAGFLAYPDELLPAEAPKGLTLEALESQYRQHRDQWQASSCWKCLKVMLSSCLDLDGPKITNCVSLGMGSLSGLSKGGLVDRRNVSLDQLAALDSILDLLSRMMTTHAFKRLHTDRLRREVRSGDR